jgi:hypothetical protein
MREHDNTAGCGEPTQRLASHAATEPAREGERKRGREGREAGGAAQCGGVVSPARRLMAVLQHRCISCESSVHHCQASSDSIHPRAAFAHRHNPFPYSHSSSITIPATCSISSHLTRSLVRAHITMRQHLSLIPAPVPTQTKMRHSLAPPQHACQPPNSFSPDHALALIQMRQRLACPPAPQPASGHACRIVKMTVNPGV